MAAGFIVVMYVLIGAMVTGLLAAGLLQSEVGASVAAVVGAALGAAFGVWRIRRTPEEERADDGGY
jgi:positive regulator of sigma E activity